ncbi:MAG: superoxide dismutase [Candidatus Andersenbacteria bacterium]|nr:superoxide dismutase [Candidatus Andersenbacteria bacterium]
MDTNEEKFYKLFDLPYDYDALVPYISEDQLRIHHQKHHAGYVVGVNMAFKKLDKARSENTDLDMRSTLKDLSFNIGGYLLHSLFWNNLSPANGREGEPSGKLLDIINDEFGSFERFQKEFIQTALSVEGSGWAALAYCKCTKRPLLMQIEKHNMNIYPAFKMLLVLDMWEHSYYLDYKNDRGKYIDAFWKIVNWKKAGERFKRLTS